MEHVDVGKGFLVFSANLTCRIVSLEPQTITDDVEFLQFGGKRRNCISCLRWLHDSVTVGK